MDNLEDRIEYLENELELMKSKKCHEIDINQIAMLVYMAFIGFLVICF